MGSKGDKGIIMQVLIKKFLPQGRRVGDGGFNKREKKMSASIKKIKRNNLKFNVCT